MSGFHGAFATGVASQQGTLETKFLELAMSLLDFSPRIPLGTFSILLKGGGFKVVVHPVISRVKIFRWKLPFFSW